MVDTRRSASAKNKAKSSAPTKQRTLFDLFPAKSTTATSAPIEQDESAQTASVPSVSTNTEDTKGINMAPIAENFRQTSLEPRPLHPFFTKPATPSPAPVELLPQIIEIEDDEILPGPASTGSDSIALIESSGSQEDPIIVETKALKPLRSSKAGVSKPLAPLFAPRRPKAPPAPSPPQSPEVELIELPDETAKPKLAPIFASRPSKATPSSSDSRLSETKEVVAPFPNKEWQHVRGPQHVFPPSAIPYGRLAKRQPASTLRVSYEAGSLKELLTEKDIAPSTEIAPTTTLDKDTYLDTIPEEHRKHPAISRFTTASQPEGSAHRLWVDKWRPSRAAEILGNEDNAVYLRDWIRALELEYEGYKTPEANVQGKGKAKAKCSRGTKRPRTIIREVEKKRGKKKQRVDSEDEDDSWIVYDDTSPAPSSPARSSGSPLPDLGEGIAQHTFASLTNTILLAGPSGTGKSAAVYACAEELGWDVLEVYPGIGRRNGAGIDGLIGDAGKNHHVRKARLGGTVTAKGDEATSTDTGTEEGMLTRRSVRQSLILLEEVDILFKDDTNFWTAVTNFIKDCRRPVICTCNDITLVPTQDLPLQTILDFRACGPQLAVSYLQALCFREDHSLPRRETLLRMYGDSAYKVGDIDLPDPGTRDEADLRRTINGLQFLCTSASGNEGWETSASYVRHGAWDTAEVSAGPDETRNRADDWQGAGWSTNGDAVGHTMRGDPGGGCEATRERVGLEGLVPEAVVRMRRREIELDYMSRIRDIVGGRRSEARRRLRRSRTHVAVVCPPI